MLLEGLWISQLSLGVLLDLQSRSFILRIERFQVSKYQGPRSFKKDPKRFLSRDLFPNRSLGPPKASWVTPTASGEPTPEVKEKTSAAIDPLRGGGGGEFFLCFFFVLLLMVLFCFVMSCFVLFHFWLFLGCVLMSWCFVLFFCFFRSSNMCLVLLEWTYVFVWGFKICFL